ncbi:MAG: hypothetical protein LC687_01065 [Actinobacteria bacterium]|nr:hypothetical protein [Actinomycetota bacterium]
MAVEIGTATDYLDLLGKLKTFITTNGDLVAAGQEWVTLRDDGTDMIFKGPGLSSTEEIFIGFRPYANPATDTYSIELAAFTGYSAGVVYDDQPGRINTKDAFLPGWTSTTPYWFIANGQRIIVISKVSTTYQSMYIGKFFPYGTPNQYPYPVFFGGMTNYHLDRFSGTDLSFFPSGLASENYAFMPSGVLYNSTTSYPGSTTFSIFPFFLSRMGTTSTFAEVAPFDSGDVVLMQSVLFFGGNNAATTPLEAAMLGELDGIFWINGINQSSESIVTYGGYDHLVFQDGGKTGVNDYAAVRLV